MTKITEKNLLFSELKKKMVKLIGLMHAWKIEFTVVVDVFSSWSILTFKSISCHRYKNFKKMEKYFTLAQNYAIPCL